MFKLSYMALSAEREVCFKMPQQQLFSAMHFSFGCVDVPVKQAL